MAYRVEYTTAAERFIRKLDGAMQSRVLAKVEKIAEAPRGMGAVKLSGHDAYRDRLLHRDALPSAPVVAGYILNVADRFRWTSVD